MVSGEDSAEKGLKEMTYCAIRTNCVSPDAPTKKLTCETKEEEGRSGMKVYRDVVLLTAAKL
jgi:hypothetical protein